MLRLGWHSLRRAFDHTPTGGGTALNLTDHASRRVSQLFGRRCLVRGFDALLLRGRLHVRLLPLRTGRRRNVVIALGSADRRAHAGGDTLHVVPGDHGVAHELVGFGALLADGLAARRDDFFELLVGLAVRERGDAVQENAMESVGHILEVVSRCYLKDQGHRDRVGFISHRVLIS